MNLFAELSLIIFLATALALIARLLRQPLIVAYIATGVLAGPYALNIIQSHEEIEIGEAKLVVSTIPDIKTNILLASHYRSKNPYGILITISHDVEGSKELYRAGASYVVMPHHLGAHHAAMLMEKYGFNTEAFDKERDEHMSKLTSLLQ